VRPGPNQQIPPKDLAHALGGDTIDALSRQTGMNRDDLLEQLSQHLPEFVDQLTPQGHLPTEEEATAGQSDRRGPSGRSFVICSGSESLNRSLTLALLQATR
jgi:uncharacterized protein YidB (DUF937 family)